MKNSLFIFSILLGLLLAGLSTEAATPYQYKKFWQQSDWVKSDAKSSFKVLQKENLVLPGVVVATVTVTKNNKESVQNVLQLMKKTLKLDKWSEEKIDGLDLYEGLHKPSGTIYRLIMNKKTNEFSVASIKSRFLIPAYLEAHQWQVELLTTKKASGKTSAFFNLLMPTAVAGFESDSMGGITFNSGINTESINSTISHAGGQIQTSLDRVGGQMNNVTNQIGNITTTGNNMAGSVNNMAGSANNVAGSINNAAGSVNTAAGSINNAAGGMNNLASSGNNLANQIGGAGKTLNDALSSKNIARVSAVAGTTFGLTSSLSSMATHFLVHGGYEVLRTFYFEAAGEFKPEEKEKRLAQFKSSMETFEKFSPQLAELENKVSVLAMLMNYSAKANSEDILAQLSSDIEKKKRQSTEAEAPCAECGTGGSALSLPQLEAMKAVVAQTGLSKSNLEKEGCSLLDSLYRNWTSVEYSLSRARRDIIQDMALFNGAIITGTQRDRAFQEQRKQENTCEKVADQKLRQLKGKKGSEDCETDFSTVICREYQAYASMKESCVQSSKDGFTELDQAQLAESARNLTSTMTQFRLDLQQMGCENKSGCDAGALNKVKAQFDSSFGTAAKSCDSSFFAKEVSRRNRLAAASTSAVKEPATVKALEAKTETSCSGVFNCMKYYLTRKPTAKPNQEYFNQYGY